MMTTLYLYGPCITCHQGLLAQEPQVSLGSAHIQIHEAKPVSDEIKSPSLFLKGQWLLRVVVFYMQLG